MVQLMQWFWRPEYWLPPGITWEDLKETEDIRYPQPRHLLLCFPITLLLITIRFIFERKIAFPLSKKLGLKEKVRREPFPNQILEDFYTKWRKSPQKKPWFWNVSECLDGYPQQSAQLSLLGFYLMQFSLYWSLLITMPLDNKQKDFYMMIAHHVGAIVLIGFSYCVNFIRIGSVTMVLHDVTNWLLYAAKLFNYLKWEKTCNTVFIIFGLVFLLSHVIAFPYMVLHNTYYYLPKLHQPYFGYYFFNALLIVEYLLNVLWFCFIIIMVYRLLLLGKVEKDVRSDSEGSEEEDVDEVDQKAE
ncbi:ceramide synthase 4-like [Erythrolamprus reginae]|uniref:ceramide synthase 4-like n=1 Tax=Erythrolamprus reginae TaxID=121349 RepID=UPI00396CFB72